MSKNQRRMRNLGRIAALGGAFAGLSLGGLALLTASHAQDKPQKMSQETPREKTPAVADTAPAAPVAGQALQARTVGGQDAAAETPAPPVKAAPRPQARLDFHGDRIQGKPVFFRRPMGPARVEWAQAMGQSNRMRPMRKGNGFAARLAGPELNRTRLPVILPRDGFIVTTKARMMSFGDAYALNMPQDKGVQITMYGNRAFVPGDKGDISSRAVQKLAGVPEDVRIGEMEDGWTATFTRYGVVYSIDVSCDDVNSDDCKTDAYIRNAIAQFDDVTMGSDAEAEAAADGAVSSSSSSAPSANWLDQVSRTINKITRGG